MKKSRYILIFIFLISIIGLSSCKKKNNDDNKPAINNQICVLEKNIDENEMVEGELQLYTYATYTFIPQEDGFYNCVCSSKYHDKDNNTSYIGELGNILYKPYEIYCKTLERRINTPSIVYGCDSDTYYFLKNYVYKINVLSLQNREGTSVKKSYKMKITKASFCVDSLITKNYESEVEYNQILIVDNVDECKCIVNECDGLKYYSIYNVSDVKLGNLSTYGYYHSLDKTSYSYLFNNSWNLEQNYTLKANQMYAFVLDWDMVTVENKIVKPTLVKC